MKISKGEEKILSILLKNRVNFIREKSFNDLKYGRLRFDFFLPDYNIIIEVDGVQHFKYINFFFKTRKSFLSYKERDRIKNSYCLSHNIVLLRIPYFELDNISTINDIFNFKYRVKSKWHNDYVKCPK